MLWFACALVLATLAPALVTLNAASLVLHRQVADTSFLTSDVHVAQAVAFGPLSARAEVASALLAERNGNVAAELAALSRAQTQGGWDASLGLRLGDLRLATGDRPGAITAWRAVAALPTLLDRAATRPNRRSPVLV